MPRARIFLIRVRLPDIFMIRHSQQNQGSSATTTAAKLCRYWSICPGIAGYRITFTGKPWLRYFRDYTHDIDGFLDMPPPRYRSHTHMSGHTYFRLFQPGWPSSAGSNGISKSRSLCALAGYRSARQSRERHKTFPALPLFFYFYYIIAGHDIWGLFYERGTPCHECCSISAIISEILPFICLMRLAYVTKFLLIMDCSIIPNTDFPWYRYIILLIGRHGFPSPHLPASGHAPLHISIKYKN